MRILRELTDMGARVIVAMLAGAGLVALAALASGLLPRGGLPNALGGWPLLAALAALLCGVCALGMSLGLRWTARRAGRLVGAALLMSALGWGVSLSAAVFRADWERFLTGAQPLAPLARAVAPLAALGASLVIWLLCYAALAGLLAGVRNQAGAMRRAGTPLWLTPLWGAGVAVIYGLLFAIAYTAPSCPPGYHCYPLDTSRWDGLRIGLGLGASAGLALGLALTMALRLALVARPSFAEPAARRLRSLAAARRLEA